MSLVTAFYILLTYEHIDQMLTGWEKVDCSYHRVLEFLYKGAPQFNWDESLTQD
jgi:hypothetical protein